MSNNSGTTSTLPVPIRRAGTGEHVDRSTLSTTPGGANFWGSTPGGTKMVYSREQLLALSTSPLARSSAQDLASIPAAISKSPEKSANFGAHMAAIRASSGGDHAPILATTAMGGMAASVAKATKAQPTCEGDRKAVRLQEEQFEMDL